jgi:hypothetical protein
MADVAGSLHIPQAARVRALVIPREHGGWGLMLIPLVTGACVGATQGHGAGNLAFFLAACLALFWLRTPLEALLGLGVMRIHTREEQRAVLQAIAVLAPLAGLSAVALMWGGRNRELLPLSAVAIMSVIVQYSLRLFGRKTRMAAQMAGAIALTSAAAGAFYVVSGRFDSRALALWFGCWLFACDQIHYVHLRMNNVRTRGSVRRFSASGRFLIGQLTMLLVVALASQRGVLPALAVIAFLPVFFRGLLWLADEGETLDVKWLGMTELMQGISFGVLLVATFYVHF